MFRPDSGGCWGLRFPGGHQWHVGYDPVTVETCFRAAAAQYPWTRTAYGTGDEPAARYDSRAVCSVACLAWIRWGKRSHAHLPVATGKDDILWKPYLQKRLRIDGIRGGKHLGSHTWICGGLQCVLSGNRVLCTGNGTAQARKGNCPFGDDGLPAGKANPT